MQNPTGSNRADSQKCRESENSTRLTPKPPQENATQRPKPRTPDARRQSQRAQQRTDAGRAHQSAQAAGSAVQNPVREDRHKHGVGHRHQADQAEQKQQRANRRSLADKIETFDQMSQSRPRTMPAGGPSTRISSSPIITAM